MAKAPGWLNMGSDIAVFRLNSIAGARFPRDAHRLSDGEVVWRSAMPAKNRPTGASRPRFSG